MLGSRTPQQLTPTKTIPLISVTHIGKKSSWVTLAREEWLLARAGKAIKLGLMSWRLCLSESNSNCNRVKSWTAVWSMSGSESARLRLSIRQLTLQNFMVLPFLNNSSIYPKQVHYFRQVLVSTYVLPSIVLTPDEASEGCGAPKGNIDDVHRVFWNF